MKLSHSTEPTDSQMGKLDMYNYVRGLHCAVIGSESDASVTRHRVFRYVER